MPTVIAFYPDYNVHHKKVLQAFVDGIPGAEMHPLEIYKRCDIAVIFGTYKISYQKTLPKKHILENHSGRQLIVIESAFVKRKEYYQIGWGGYAGNADFCNQNVPIDRWESFGVRTKPWQRRPESPVVICGQLKRDTQVQHTDHIKWCYETVQKVLKSGEKVLFRPHPRETNPKIYNVSREYWDIGKVNETVRLAKCFVTWNSTSAVDALVAGVPVIACHKSSIAWPVAQHSIDDVSNLRYPSRRRWLASLGYAQWSLEEMRLGLPWRHLNGC